MNWAHVHLAVNHVPVVLIPVAVALLAFAIVRRSAEITGVSLGLLVIAAVLAGGVYLTGEPAEEFVEHLPGITHETIEEHEEAAEIAAVVTVLAGLSALAMLVAGPGGQQAPTWLLATTFVLAFAAAGLMARAANLGGFIRHSEIAAAGASAPPGVGASQFRATLRL